jgi:hypothetical protein
MTGPVGRCLCGKVSHSLTAEPVAVVISNCRRKSCSAFSVNAFVAKSAYLQNGKTRVFTDIRDSGGSVYRHLGLQCGSPILSAVPALPDHAIVKVRTLDVPGAIVPIRKVDCDRAIPREVPFPETTRAG